MTGFGYYLAFDSICFYRSNRFKIRLSENCAQTAAQTGFFFREWASAKFSVWSSSWFCKMSGSRSSERGAEGAEKKKTPTPLVACFDSP